MLEDFRTLKQGDEFNFDFSKHPEILIAADMTPEEIKVSIRAMLDRETDIATLQDVWISNYTLEI